MKRILLCISLISYSLIHAANWQAQFESGNAPINDASNQKQYIKVGASYGSCGSFELKAQPDREIIISPDPTKRLMNVRLEGWQIKGNEWIKKGSLNVLNYKHGNYDLTTSPIKVNYDDGAYRIYCAKIYQDQNNKESKEYIDCNKVVIIKSDSRKVKCLALSNEAYNPLGLSKTWK